MPEARRTIDLNADAGEGGDDAALAPFITSVSVACGGHEGDAASMRRTLELAAAHGLRAGAHPSYPDREGFGRRHLEIAGPELAASVEAQVGSLRDVAREVGVELTHVKAHGALYNDMWDDAALAAAFAAAVARVLPAARLVVPAVSAARRAAGPAALAEVFLDRRYAPDGRLLARTEPGAVLAEPAEIGSQLARLASVEFQTMCVHGDNPAAAVLLRAARAELGARGWRVAPYGLP